MKHIKRFNEDMDNEEELKDFCETHLAYLLDDYNFELGVDDYTQNGKYRSQIRLENGKGFYWDDIKDYFIPFLIQLDKIRGHQIKIDDDKLIFVCVSDSHSKWIKVRFDDLVNDFESDSFRNPWTKIHIELRDE
jgi:hypothetical protein